METLSIPKEEDGLYLTVILFNFFTYSFSVNITVAKRLFFRLASFFQKSDVLL